MIGVGFKSVDVGKLTRDFERVSLGLLPRMSLEMSRVGRSVRDEARRRFVNYADAHNLNPKPFNKAAKGVQSDSGILRSEIGAYASVGQTLPRAKDEMRRRPSWSLLMYTQGLGPALDAKESEAERAMESAPAWVMTENHFT